MINLSYELGQQFRDECRHHLSTLETDFLAMESSEAAVGEQRVNRAFRAAHSIKGAADTLALWKVRDVARQVEDVLTLIRSHRMVPTPDEIGLLLRATDRMNALILDPDTGTETETAEIVAALAGIHEARSASTRPANATSDSTPRRGRPLLTLVVEDDFASRLVLQTFLSRYGECHVAVNGREAVEAVRAAFHRGQRYDLICMDIMMPEMNGREAVRQVRALEEARGVLLAYGAKIIMTTALDDIKEVFQCFKELCDAYLVKPIDLAKLLSHMKSYEFV